VSDHEGKSPFDLGMLGEIANDRRMTRRKVLQGAAAAGALAALGPFASACGSSSPDTSASPSVAASPKKGGHLRSAVTGGSTKGSLDAHTAYIDAGMKCTQMYDQLMGWDAESKLMMRLAESYEVNPDATVYTVKLKSGLTFIDGSPVNADSVIYSFRRILDPKTNAYGRESLAGLKPSGLKKLDDLTVSMTLEETNPIFVESLAFYPNSIVPVGYTSPHSAKDCIGCGPFKITSYTPGQESHFVANPDYWGEGPYVDELTIIEFSDATAKLNALLGGAADHLAQLQNSQVGTVKATPGVKALEAKGGGWDPFTMAIDLKPFDDVRVRQAFRLIVDRPQMIAQAMNGFSWVGNDMYAPYDPGYPKDLPQRVQDLEQAKSLLKQAGYDNDLQVVLNCSIATGPSDPDAAQVFAQQAKGAGVTVKVNKVDPNAFWNTGNYGSYPFSMTMWGTRNYLAQTKQAMFPSSPFYETHWKDAEWEKIVNEAFKTVDDNKRNELVNEAQRIEYERGSYILYQFGTLVDGYSDKLGGLVPDAFGSNGAINQHFNTVYFV
jgi:peptide/nickel transport system substrate-binding protein